MIDKSPSEHIDIAPSGDTNVGCQATVRLQGDTIRIPVNSELEIPERFVGNTEPIGVVVKVVNTLVQWIELGGESGRLDSGVLARGEV